MGQDMDHESLPSQVNLGYQVPREKQADYVGKAALEAAREQFEAGNPPYRTQLVGLIFGGNPIEDYAPDFRLVGDTADPEPVGYVTSPWYSPELQANVALAHVPVGRTGIGEEYWIHLPQQYAQTPGTPIRAEITEVPFRPSVNPNQREILKSKGLDAAV